MKLELEVREEDYRDTWDWRTPIIRAFRRVLKRNSYVTVFEGTFVHIDTPGERDFVLQRSKDYKRNKEFFDFLQEVSDHYRDRMYVKRKSARMVVHVDDSHVPSPALKMKSLSWPRYFLCPYRRKTAYQVPMKDFRKGVESISDAARIKRIWDSLHPEDPKMVIRICRSLADWNNRNLRVSLSREDRDVIRKECDGIEKG